MADPQSEARIRDLERRMAAMPGSRIFVGLAEEYRRAGRFNDALATLRTGLEAHPGYLSARIAIARLYQEMGRDDEAIEAFARVLAADRENLVAAKALGDLHGRRGNAVEAVKKYKLYRALSGDRSIDDKIAALEKEAKFEPPAPAPPPAPVPASGAEPRMFDPINYSDSSAEFRFDPNATLALSTLEFSPAPVETPAAAPVPEAAPPVSAAGEPGLAGAAASPAPAPPGEAAIPEEALSLSEITLPDLILPGRLAEPPAPGVAEEVPSVSAGVPVSPGVPPEAASAAPAEEALAEAPLPEAAPPAPLEAAEAAYRSDAAIRETAPAEGEEPVIAPPPELPPSRTLAELYERQGFREEASRIYERLAAEHPGDESLTRRITALRSPEGSASAESAAEDPRARKRRVLESWLARVKANAVGGASPS